MFFSWAARQECEQKTEYAKTSDFADIFVRDMGSLFCLALLLTAKPRNAERCLLAALDLCSEGPMVLHRWAPAWARRTVLKSAIQLMSPVRTDAQNYLWNNHELEGNSWLEHPLSCVRILPTFDRFVYVMSVLERYRRRECAVLLNCSAIDVLTARVRSLRQMAKFDRAGSMASIGADSGQRLGRAVDGLF